MESCSLLRSVLKIQNKKDVDLDLDLEANADEVKQTKIRWEKGRGRSAERFEFKDSHQQLKLSKSTQSDWSFPQNCPSNEAFAKNTVFDGARSKSGSRLALPYTNKGETSISCSNKSQINFEDPFTCRKSPKEVNSNVTSEQNKLDQTLSQPHSSHFAPESYNMVLLNYNTFLLRTSEGDGDFMPARNQSFLNVSETKKIFSQKKNSQTKKKRASGLSLDKTKTYYTKSDAEKDDYELRSVRSQENKKIVESNTLMGSPRKATIRPKSAMARRPLSGGRNGVSCRERAPVFPLSEVKFKDKLTRPRSVQGRVVPRIVQRKRPRSSSCYFSNVCHSQRTNTAVDLKTSRSAPEPAHLPTAGNQREGFNKKAVSYDRVWITGNKFVRRARSKSKTAQKKRPASKRRHRTGKNEKNVKRKSESSLQRRLERDAKTALKLYSGVAVASAKHQDLQGSAPRSTSTGRSGMFDNATSQSESVDEFSENRLVSESSKDLSASEGQQDSCRKRTRKKGIKKSRTVTSNSQHEENEALGNFSSNHPEVTEEEPSEIECNVVKSSKTTNPAKGKRPKSLASATTKNRPKSQPAQEKSKLPLKTYQHMGLPPLVRSPSSENTFHCRLLMASPIHKKKRKTSKRRRKSMSFKKI